MAFSIIDLGLISCLREAGFSQHEIASRVTSDTGRAVSRGEICLALREIKRLEADPTQGQILKTLKIGFIP